ncbi:hypothetical protein FOZ63_027820 [Perkinsus olseni]|uniref:Uncharacterized protein n=1 Tax=Perkinsus olseni TaxID=32597 RepID=A0A7J6SRV7_PEROL|nr:hypothetical protein FOZ63_027820 [Perkinsus olseni]
MDIAVIPKESLGGRVDLNIQSGYEAGCNMRMVVYSGRATKGFSRRRGSLGTVVLPAKQEVKVALSPEKSCQHATGSGSIVRQMYVDALALDYRLIMATDTGS